MTRWAWFWWLLLAACQSQSRASAPAQPAPLPGGVGSRVTTQREFEHSLSAALADTSQVHLLNVLLNPADRSPGMVRLARRLGKKLSTDKP